MDAEHETSRPIGWWLKEADARLDAAFDSALVGTTVDRRSWQVLATLSRGPTRRVELVNALATFDPPALVDEAIDDLIERGWVEDTSEQLTLTSVGAGQHVTLAPLVDGVRALVVGALPQSEYVVLVGLLSRLVAALPPRLRAQESRRPDPQ